MLSAGMHSALMMIALTVLAVATACAVVPTTATSSRNLVVTCQPLAAKIGIDVLKNGGNAADAFVATTVAEYVTAPGYTSLSGPLYVLYFDAKTQKTSYLNAGLNTVADSSGQWSDEKKVPGTAYVIGGAARGLEVLFRHFGSSNRKFKDLIAPSVELAKNGFVIDPSFAGTIRARLPILKGSARWMSLFTKDGEPLKTGATLLQNDLADTLTRFGEDGADYLFKGKYAQNLTKLIRSQGGKLTLKDLANYKTQWSDPLETKYRGLTIQTSSYRSYGGFELLLNLKTIENWDLAKQPHFSKDEDTFAKVLATMLFGKTEVFRYMDFANRVDAPDKFREVLEGPLPKEIWAKVAEAARTFPGVKDAGSHSCSPVIIDKDGNIATGTHTINTLPWGDYGFMVDGVSINTAHAVALDAPPGVRAIDGLNPVLVLKDGKPIIAASFFSSGLHSAAFQTLLNLIDYQMTAQQAIGAPRFGPPTSYKPIQMVIDRRISSHWIADFAKKGIQLSQPNGFVDTGMAMVIRIDPLTHLRTGSPTDLLHSAAAIGD